MLEGFCGISRRKGLKPIIAAVNGYALGTIISISCHLHTQAEDLRWLSIGWLIYL